MRKKIKIEQDQIDRGRKGHCAMCPVSLAITEQTGLLCTVGYAKIALEPGVDYRSMDTPKSVIKFISEFDISGTGQPFNFFLVIR